MFARGPLGRLKPEEDVVLYARAHQKPERFFVPPLADVHLGKRLYRHEAGAF